MEILAAIGAVLTFLGGLPDIIATIKGWIDSIAGMIRQYQMNKVSKDLAAALEKATKEKDTRDLEKIFDPDRKFPKSPPSGS